MLAEMQMLQKRLTESQAAYDAMGPPVKQELDEVVDDGFRLIVQALVEETMVDPISIEDTPPRKKTSLDGDFFPMLPDEDQV